MRILHWEEAFHPNFGYQTTLLTTYQAKRGHEVIILAADCPWKNPNFSGFSADAAVEIERPDREFEKRTGVKVVRVPAYGVVSGRMIYKPGYIKKINSYHPDVIMCHTSDTLSAMTILWKHKRIHAPLVFDNHMLEMASVNRFSKVFRWGYRKFVTPIIKKNQFITIRTQDDPYIMKRLGVPEELAPYISFGTDTDLFYPDETVYKQFRQELKIPQDAFVVLYCGKLSAAKGGLLLAQALEKKLPVDRETVMVLVGNIDDDDYGKQVKETLEHSENRIIKFGTQNYRDLAKFYQIADLAFYPRQCSLSYFDVQACGLPVILEDEQINVDRVRHNNGFVFRSGSAEDLVEKICMCIRMPEAQYREMKKASRENVMQNYDYNEIERQYTEILEREMHRQKKWKQ